MIGHTVIFRTTLFYKVNGKDTVYTYIFSPYNILPVSGTICPPKKAAVYSIPFFWIWNCSAWSVHIAISCFRNTVTKDNTNKTIYAYFAIKIWKAKDLTLVKFCAYSVIVCSFFSTLFSLYVLDSTSDTWKFDGICSHNTRTT